MGKILRRLLERGDSVSVANGRLQIKPRSGKVVPKAWLDEHEESLVKEILECMGAEALKYVSYSTGKYGQRYEGVTLQLESVRSEEPFYVIFNACLKRQRTSKAGRKGELLPSGRFSVGKKSLFFQLWKSTGLPYRRMGEWHERMGRLGELFFAGAACGGERIDASTLRPLEVSADEVLAAVLGKQPADNRQVSGKAPAVPSGNESSQTLVALGFGEKSTAGRSSRGSKVIRGCGDKAAALLASGVWTEEELEQAYQRGWGAIIHGEKL